MIHVAVYFVISLFNQITPGIFVKNDFFGYYMHSIAWKNM